MRAVILGAGPMGQALAVALQERGITVELLGRPASGVHPQSVLAADVVLDASVGSAVHSNVAASVQSGCRAFVIATTAWEEDREAIERDMRSAGAAGVWASNLSLGCALFGRLVERAASLYAVAPSFEPFLLEWHRRAKRDRPSGTAVDLARRIDGASPSNVEIVSLRAGSAPGMHLVGFDAPGETVELRITARDRSPYAAGALAAIDWLLHERRRPGLHPFDSVVDDLVATAPLSADVAAATPVATYPERRNP